ncbi:MAG: serine O-acetyltransferase [Candidatus Krumholzibacteriota bacterium]|nr:serine O-acetyltransferase [Candidatus Krumholzibacteriota bacterium]
MLLARVVRRFKDDYSVAFRRDPAARGWWSVIFCYPGLHALFNHRVAHYLWRQGLRFWARWISHLSRFVTGVEIHPGASIGGRVFIDHGAGVVIGETAEIGDDTVIYQGVTLGGVSLSKGKRHPTIGKGVVIGAGAKVLGPVMVGDGARIGAGSVVVKDVPDHGVAVGVPAMVISRRHHDGDRISLRHDKITDPLLGVIRRLEERVYRLEKELARRETGPNPEQAAG